MASRLPTGHHCPGVGEPERCDFTLMKTHRILGILWAAYCCYSCFNLFRALLSHLHPTAGGHEVAWPVLAVLAVSFLMYLAGIVASIFLFRGATWARWIIAVIAVYMLLGCVACVVTQKSLPIWAASSGVVALVSLALLFLPRHEPVA
jgi:hypothetical protein